MLGLFHAGHLHDQHLATHVSDSSTRSKCVVVVVQRRIYCSSSPLFYSPIIKYKF